MLRLCGFRISNYHNKVRIVLLEKGIEHEEDASLSPRQTADYLARSPMGKAPFLEIEGDRRLIRVAGDLRVPWFVHLPLVSLATKLGYGRDVSRTCRR